MKLASFKALDERHHWTDAQKLVCVMVTPEAPDVKSFCFKTADDSWFRYLPGQFITLELPVNDEKLLRTYTLSSSPSRPLAISEQVKAQPDTLGPRWLFATLQFVTPEWKRVVWGK